MPGSKCSMPSALNGLHIRHEFRGKAEITCSCASPSRLHRRNTCLHTLKDSHTLLKGVRVSLCAHVHLWAGQRSTSNDAA